MSFFTKKQEVDLEDFCSDFYENRIYKRDSESSRITKTFISVILQSSIEADDSFSTVDLAKLEKEITILQFELFALAWIVELGDSRAINQSIFTKKFLEEKGDISIWNDMKHYNKAISHATKVDNPLVLKMRADLADKFIKYAESQNIEIGESIGRPANRMYGEKAWKKMTTSYFLMLALCHRLGLGSGPDYLGPNKKAQLNLESLISEIYKEAKQVLSEIKIRND